MGFSFVGFSKADFLEEEAPRLEKWLQDKQHGEMSYMENHFDKRLDPRIIGGRFKISYFFVIQLSYRSNYKADPTAPKISTYAYGEDYHFVVKHKLKSLTLFH